MKYGVITTVVFSKWLKKLKDKRGKVKINDAIDDMEDGNFGDHRDLKNGLWERRIHFGPGYRIYYFIESGKIIILLQAGIKGEQKSDIIKALKLKKGIS